MPRAGEMDRRITILRAATATDGFNNPVPVWPPLMTVWAKWRAATANERLAQQEVGAEIEDVFEIRWSTLAGTVNPKDRLRFGDREYDIVEATEIPRRKGVRIKAVARPD
jgi:SPP1 family predicted phage head-tail adaptor